MDTTTAADTIADFVETAREHTPSPVRHAAARILLNGLRATLAASGETLTTGLVAGELARLPVVGQEGTGVWWTGHRLPAEEAAAGNQLMWTMLLLDDMELVSGMHPGGPAVTSALASAAEFGAGGADVLAAIAAGIEVQVAIALAGSPEMLQVHGFAPLSVLAPMGSVVAACVLARADRQVVRDAVGIAAMSGVGMWEMGGTPSAGYLTASATRAGVAALRAARAGFVAPERALDGAFGAFHAFTGKPAEVLHRALAELGTRWRTGDVLFQPYSGDTYSQAPLAALAEVRGQFADSLPPTATEIVVRVDQRTATGVRRKYDRHPVIHEPLVLNSDPQSRLAAAWLHDAFSFDHRFAEFVADPAVRDLRERVRFVADESIPDMSGAAVEVVLADGRRLTAAVAGFRGSPVDPQSDEGLADWFRAVAATRLDPARTERIIDQVWGLEFGGEVAGLLGEISGPVAV
ncbi:MAG TPA: MmgE/PrpD family protein [Pseudonocardiaceae bacterium]|jgi:2-methylcitrate dehydratase PrpD|nr:MmgE/PrpD family protein [Pseudonocardiaceae bacterium]